MKAMDPLQLQLGPADPGIIVTQSVHKQQSGFGQASQIHKKTPTSKVKPATSVMSSSITPTSNTSPPVIPIRSMRHW